MDHFIWVAPIQSIAILGSIIAIWSFARNVIPWPWPQAGGLAFAIAMGGGTIILMSMPMNLLPGVMFDFRNAVLAASALIGGPVMIIAGLIAAAYRLYLGGNGALSGVAGILFATGIGIWFNLRIRGRDPTFRAILLLALLTAVSTIAIFVFLPQKMFMQLSLESIVVMMVLTFLATGLVGFVLRQDRISSRMARENITYRAIIEALPDSLNVKDRNGRFIAANPATAQLLGAHSVKELVGKSDFDFFPPDTAQRFLDDEQTIIADAKPVTLQQRAVMRDGTELFLETLKAPLYDGHGQFIGLITHNRDVTRTEGLRRELEDAQVKLKDAIDNMDDGLAMFDVDGRLTYCNERYLQLFPRTAHLRVPGTKLGDLAYAAFESGEALVDAQTVDRWLGQIADRADEAPIIFQTFDGRWLHARATAVRQGTLLMISDITERHLAELEIKKTAAEYHALFDNSAAGIFRSTVDGTWLKVNPAMAALSGFENGAAMLDEMTDIAGQWYADPTRRGDFQRLMMRDGRLTDFVSEVRRHKTGERIWVSETAWLIHDGDGLPAYYEGTAIEITDRKRAEEEMAKTNVRLLSLASTDGLTGLMNRRSFDEVLERELSEAALIGKPFSLIMIDVDHFKAYNDRYGHPAGDECLRFIGKMLIAVCRGTTDVACRYGGEELAIILPGTPEDAAIVVAKRFCGSVRGLNLKHEASPFGRVTVSAGVATMPAGSAEASATLIRRADEALYIAKDSGRDRAEIHRSDLEGIAKHEAKVS